MDYVRADFAPLAATGYGLGVHWTTWTLPREGEGLPFPEAVERFDVRAFTEAVQESGAGHVLFMGTHELHWLPGPNPVVDRILPGRTCRRDLIGELAEALNAAGIMMGLYYNHGVLRHPTWEPGAVQDPEWQEAVGSPAADRSRYYDNYCEILTWMGEHYGRRLAFYWFDSGYEHIKFNTPWARFTAAAKAGNPDRLVTYNSGFSLESYTEHQDYWAGELYNLDFVPAGRATPAGLPWYSFCTWHRKDPGFSNGEWGIQKRSRPLDWPPPPVEKVAEFINRFQGVGGTVTFNLLCYQDGSILESDLDTLRQVGRLVRRREAARQNRAAPIFPGPAAGS